MIMYGGQKSGPLDDIWAFDLASNTWNELTPAIRPGGRFFATSVYDSINHRVTIFGGNTGGGKSNEVWVFDLATNTWQQLDPEGMAPSARDGSAAVYDRALGRIVFFGGHDGAPRNDVWALQHLSDSVGIPDAPADRTVRLHANAPNPFNLTTRVPFDLPHDSDVTLRVYDVRGRLVRQLIDGFRPAGPNAVTWDGRDDTGRPASAGVYLCRLDSGGESAARKIVLSK